MAQSAIITCAPTGGIHTPTMSEHLPITPDQIAQGQSTRPRPPSSTSMPVTPRPENPTQLDFGAAQVTKIRTIIEALGLRVATPDEARARLDLKGADRVDF